MVFVRTGKNIMNTASRPRGRPRSYDPQQALRRARDSFWRAGYAGTSLDDLAAAMAMNRPSVYAAFGDKRALYEQTLARYAANSCTALERTLALPGSLREILGFVYAGATEFYLAGGRARGCYLVGTALTEARASRKVRALLESTFQRFTQLFEARFELAAAELSTAPDPSALAHIATATLNTLSLRARSGAGRATLEALSSATIAVICRREPANGRSASTT
jgi:TetR/AcrR family transcriptional regulator, copper-responsive repressor